MRKISSPALLVSLRTGIAVWGLPGQTVPQPAFDAASIHEMTPPFRALKTLTVSGTRITLEGYNPGWLVSAAFGVKDYQVSADVVPRAMQGTYYMIEARAPGQSAPSTAELRVMLQTLLADRFHLTMHHEARSMPVYELVIDKNGPALKPGTGDGECASRIGPVQPTDRNYRYQFTNCTLDRLVTTLPADRPVLDKTGLTGRYDITMVITPEFRMQDTSEPGDIRFLDAVRQLSLRLVGQNAPIDVVVVDHFDAPSPN
jgi:uncharacterized protein (TIGR03435 family)